MSPSSERADGFGEDAAGVLDNISGWVDSAYLHEQATADFVRRETQESAPGRQT